MDINSIRALSNDDMQAVNQLIQQQVDSEVALINQLGFYIVNSGGKRLRPLLTVLSARAMGIKNDDHHTLAAIVEFIHTATLLHDDVVDESTMRRGRETANAIFGNQGEVCSAGSRLIIQKDVDSPLAFISANDVIFSPFKLFLA